MTVRVLFFASLRDSAGADELEIELDDAVPLDGFMPLLKDRLGEPAFEALTGESVRIALNQELTSGAVTIRPGDEIAFMPPVTGG